MTACLPSPNLSEAQSFEANYNALRAQARRFLRAETHAQSFSPTLLVHEAWIVLARSQKVAITDQTHYIRLVSRVMKNLLIDHARRKKAVINGGHLHRIDWDDLKVAQDESPALILSVAAALDQLAELSRHLPKS